jgi:mono/diheme cytochrome c family protein
MRKIFFIILFAALTLTACGTDDGTGTTAPLDAVPAEFAGKTNPLGADAAEAGADIYQANCRSCHGVQGHGDGPSAEVLNPAPKNLAELQAQVGDDYLFWRINTGKAGTAMVPWKGILTEEQIWQVVAFIRTLK